ncbi:DUF3325 family protein [Sphingomonas sp. TDK1]|uniref:DUF3325 family protein n=1 Tax=Sphingomonas sp. TDK1 TaxID=453247 RepID=UPI0007DA2675|nr:DUF3325 family protein [Sphingomonas sp. TDK1]OAN66752.1 hypothetical protein A7X12_10965 [Sphingomonas sp. TDK1]
MIAAGFTLIGFFALAAAMPRHATALLGSWQKHIRSSQLRAAGWALLATAFAVTLATPDWGRAMVGWCGTLTLAAALVLLGLTYDARLARIAAALGGVAVLAGLIQ